MCIRDRALSFGSSASRTATETSNTPGRPLVRTATVAAAGERTSWAVRPHAGTNTPRTPRVCSPDAGDKPTGGCRAPSVRGVLVPAWGRTAQLVLSPAAATVAVLTRGLPGVLLVSVAVRLALDPKDNAYYIGSAALAAVVFDLL